MSSPYTQLPLSSPVEGLKKSCICEIDGWRCTRPRQDAKTGKWDEYHQDLTTHWNVLDGEKEKEGISRRLAQYSVCRDCFELGRHHQVQEEFLREKGFLPAVTPSRQQRAPHAQTTSSAAGVSTRSRGRQRDSPKASTSRDTPNRDSTPDDETVVTAEQDTANSSSPAATAGPTNTSSPTLNETPTPPPDRSTSRDTADLAASASAHRLEAPPLDVRRRLFPSSSEPHTDVTWKDIPSTPTEQPRVPSTIAGSMTPSQEPKSDRDQQFKSPATSTIRGPMRREIPVPPPAPPAAVGQGPPQWWEAHQRDIMMLIVGGVTTVFVLLVMFFMWAVWYMESSVVIIEKVQLMENKVEDFQGRMMRVLQSCRLL